MYQEILEAIGLSQNEAKIYEGLLDIGHGSVPEISLKIGVHKRNIYDIIPKLLQKGIIYQIAESKDKKYAPTQPDRLSDLIWEKETKLKSILPALNRKYKQNKIKEAVYIYHGPEGWKNYMRDILKVGKDFYCIGAKGAWMDERNQYFFPEFIKEAKQKNIKMHHLFDIEVKEKNLPILKYVGKDYKFFPKGYSTPSSVDIFGDYVNIISGIKLGGIEEQNYLAVIYNPKIAEAFRTWFKFMWDFCPHAK